MFSRLKKNVVLSDLVFYIYLIGHYNALVKIAINMLIPRVLIFIYEWRHLQIQNGLRTKYFLRNFSWGEEV